MPFRELTFSSKDIMNSIISSIHLGKIPSRIFIGAYILGTLYLRLMLEPQLQGHTLISVGLGLFGLVFLYALIKSRFLRPDWFSFELQK